VLSFESGLGQGQFVPWDECLLEQQRLAVTAAVGAARTAAYRKLWEGSGVVTADISIENWQDLPLP